MLAVERQDALEVVDEGLAERLDVELVLLDGFRPGLVCPAAKPVEFGPVLEEREFLF